MNLSILQNPDENTVSRVLRENVDTLMDDEIALGAVLMSDIDYEAWKAQPNQANKSAAIAVKLESKQSAFAAAERQAKIDILAATGISSTTAEALLKLQGLIT